MALPIIVHGKRRNVNIKEGEVFLLPGRIPHSPQRPETGSVGLVIERERSEGELDTLRWYSDFKKCDRVLYQKHFPCYDLGRDFLPIVTGYKESEEFVTREPGTNVTTNPSMEVDTETDVPMPFKLADFLTANAEALSNGQALNLFEGHPDKEITVMIIGGGHQPEQGPASFPCETWLYQLTGEVTVTAQKETVSLGEGDCMIINTNIEYSVQRPKGSIGMVFTQIPTPLNSKKTMTSVSTW